MTVSSFLLSLTARSLSTSSATNMSSSSSLPFPVFGWGSFGLPPDEVNAALRTAIKTGYRRIDCAPVYFNEYAIGDSLKNILEEKIVQRQDLYIVSKLASPFHRKEHVEVALRKTLNDLRIDYLDLFLIHWPVAFHYVPIDPTVRGFTNEDIDDSGSGSKIDPSVSVHETWEAMEALVDKGLVRSIGVSNFPVILLQELLTRAKIQPLVNQCEAHPYLPNTKLIRYCERRGVHFQAYSPLGTPGFQEVHEPTVMEDPIIVEIAKHHQVSPAQVCLAWALHRNTSVVVKATSQVHQEDNLRALDLVLSEHDLEALDRLGVRNYRYFRPEEWWEEAGMAVFD